MHGVRTQVTSLLSAASAGDAGAADRLMRLVYDELHRIAKAQIAHEGRRDDLQTTVLVQEAYLRLFARNANNDTTADTQDGAENDAANGDRDEARTRDGAPSPAPSPQNRRQFFAFAANSMRQFLVDHARKRDRIKRGGGKPTGEVDENLPAIDVDPQEVLALDDALEKLAKLDPQAVEIVKLRYFAGLSIDETADVLGISPRLVDKEWQHARSWLKREMS